MLVSLCELVFEAWDDPREYLGKEFSIHAIQAPFDLVKTPSQVAKCTLQEYFHLLYTIVGFWQEFVAVGVGYPNLLSKVDDLIECIIDLIPDLHHGIGPNDLPRDGPLNFLDQILLHKLIAFFLFHYNNYLNVM